MGWHALFAADAPPEWLDVRSPNLSNNIARKLRYHPVDGGFVITNGEEYFNRPLYCVRSQTRVDAGDRPEFVFHLPGRGGNLRWAFETPTGMKWLHSADNMVATYVAGRMRYEIKDRALRGGCLQLDVLPMACTNGVLFRVSLMGQVQSLKLGWAFGGVNGQRYRRNGDIGCEAEPVSRLFQLRPEQCRQQKFTLGQQSFEVVGPRAVLIGTWSQPADVHVVDAQPWADPTRLFAEAAPESAQPVVVGTTTLTSGSPFYLCIFKPELSGVDPGSVPAVPLSTTTWFDEEYLAATRRLDQIAGRVQVRTPDAFVNSAVPALNVAAEAIWDEPQGSYMHGAVAWRTRLLGWRGMYAGDALGQHDRTFRHFVGFARAQNTNPIPEQMPGPDPESNLARSERALHSNGNMTRSHYDMNLVAVDALLRHVRWTGELEKIRELWPVLERHLGWERRLFRREFGPERLPLYEAYACIWASDNLQYNGGGVAHSSAYNYFANRELARCARALGLDSAGLDHEAASIKTAMDSLLWVAEHGTYGEYKDLLGLQLVHTNPALWTVYHAIDSEVPGPFQAWLMTRYVDRAIPRIPVIGPGIPAESLFTLPTSTWMPYMWSINNVVVAECMHMALAYWQAGRPEPAFALFKGTVLSTMFCGLCPGNVGMTTSYDVARREAQRDFADGIGVMARSLIEGLLGVRPDLVSGEVTVRPGWPSHWQFVQVKHPDFDLEFQRDGPLERYTFVQRFPRLASVRLVVRAAGTRFRIDHAGATNLVVAPAADGIEQPMLELLLPPMTTNTVVLRWVGPAPGGHKLGSGLCPHADVTVKWDGPEPVEVHDPMRVLGNVSLGRGELRARTGPRVGPVFVRVRQGQLYWWVPIEPDQHTGARENTELEFDWSRLMPANARFEFVDLSPFFNDVLTNIFRNEYLAPRSPFCSLSIPKHGIGGWCEFELQPEIDDSGLRAVAATNGGIFRLPNGMPFKILWRPGTPNVVFVSQWTNYPAEISIPLEGRARRLFLLMAGSTTHMQSRFVNGRVRVQYRDGSSTTLELINPINWWPIEQDYFIDHFAFRRPELIPPRIDLKTGLVRMPDPEMFLGRGGSVPGGSAQVLTVELNPEKELNQLNLDAVSNEVVLGLLALTVLR